MQLLLNLLQTVVELMKNKMHVISLQIGTSQFKDWKLNWQEGRTHQKNYPRFKCSQVLDSLHRMFIMWSIIYLLI